MFFLSLFCLLLPSNRGNQKLTPVQTAVVPVAATLSVATFVASRLHNVNLAATRPVTIDRLLRHHPDSRPQPVTAGQLSRDLDTAIGDALLALCRQASGADRRDQAALDGVRGDDARGVLGAGAGAVAAVLVGQVEGVVGEDLVVGDGGGLVGEGGHDVEAVLVDVRVALVVGGPVEAAGAVAVELDLVGPDVLVELLEVIVVDEAVLVVLVCIYSISYKIHEDE